MSKMKEKAIEELNNEETALAPLPENTDVLAPLTAEEMAILKEGEPEENTSTQKFLPRLVFNAKNKYSDEAETELIMKAGTFILEVETEEMDDKNNKIWDKKDLGKEVEIQIIHSRRQLKKFVKDGVYLNSPIYDTDTDIVTLTQKTYQQDGTMEKVEKETGTQAELQAKYPPKEGNKTSSLEDHRILYVLINGIFCQFNIGKKWEYMQYKQKVGSPSAFITKVSSEIKKNGSNVYASKIFSIVRKITSQEFILGQQLATEMKKAINESKSYGEAKRVAEDEYNAMGI